MLTREIMNVLLAERDDLLVVMLIWESVLLNDFCGTEM